MHLRVVPSTRRRHSNLTPVRKFVPAAFAKVGAQVYAPKPRIWDAIEKAWYGPAVFVLCDIVATQGFRVRVCNPLHEIDAWVPLELIRVLPTSELAMIDHRARG
jgi:hypothetical protein